MSPNTFVRLLDTGWNLTGCAPFIYLHREIKAFIGLTKPMHQLTDDQNRPILDIAMKKNMWEQYILSMFADDSRTLTVPCNLSDGYSILKDEVIKALRRAKTGKSSGPDDVHIEVIQLIEERNIDALVIFLNAVYDTGHLPKDWLASTFITLPKKANAKKCAEFRTISLMSQVLKLFLNIIHERIRAKCDEQLADSQFGFRAGVGTREALFAIQVLIQKCRDMQQDVYLCFIDYEKAFDRVLHDRLIAILHNIGLDGKDIRIIQNLYWNQRAKVWVGNEETEDVEIKRGVRQGCILSPTLFNLYSETIIAEAIEGLDCGVKINGRNINNIRYADDTVLIASSLEDIQRIVTRVNMCSENAGLRMNISKTKFMVISKNKVDNIYITVAGPKVERVRNYKYLGTWLNDTWSSDQEIRSRIEIARSTFTKMKKVLCNRRLKIPLRIRLLHCYIWPILLYGCEAWTIKEDLRKRIEAFEMWTFRRMLAISWTLKVSNEEVLRRVNQRRELLHTIKIRKVAYLGHVLRHERYELLQLIMMGRVAGRRGVGRRKKSWLRNIREWTEIASAAELFRLAKDRQEFTKLTANLC
ncbi:jg3246 [Pararge aegeria aegeria]|uniref:Jg3246 protein n=1 Tax=Pararge aegeria aegeria TaxID=348720 RepID=A0A8S4RTQ1_9NEOP|nr:jg3246 [Pararge aegeria aegeria]